MIRHVAIVCGYSCSPNKPEIIDYLETVVAELNRLRPDCLTTSGGYTERLTCPGKSEGQMMMSRLLPKINYRPTRQIVECGSYTTTDNISRCAQILEKHRHELGSARVTVFCEKARKRSVQELVRYYFHCEPEVITVDWEAGPQWLPTALMWYSMTMATVPPLHFLVRRYRMLRARFK